MKRFFPLLLVSILVLLLISCGKKGPLLPPASKIPKKIEDFQAVQRGEKLILKWTNPAAYTDGSTLSEIEEIEIWLQETKTWEPEGEFTQETERIKSQIFLKEFKKSAKLELIIKKEEFSKYQKKGEKKTSELEFPFELKEEKLALKLLAFALKVKDRKDNISDFSNLAYVVPNAVSLAPQSLKATLYDDRIEVEWKEPERNIDNTSPPNVKGYNIYRKEVEGEEEILRRMNSTLIKETKYSDKDFIFGKSYRYFVRASSTESQPFIESDDSEAVEVIAEDTFPPKVPSGLVSMRGDDFITLSWNSNQEKDLAGYRVWRREEGQKDYILLTFKPVLENVYSDSAVEKNKRYYYAITAQDKNGNESEKSQPISEMIEEKLR